MQATVISPEVIGSTACLGLGLLTFNCGPSGPSVRYSQRCLERLNLITLLSWLKHFNDCPPSEDSRGLFKCFKISKWDDQIPSANGTTIRLLNRHSGKPGVLYIFSHTHMYFPSYKFSPKKHKDVWRQLKLERCETDGSVNKECGSRDTISDCVKCWWA